MNNLAKKSLFQSTVFQLGILTDLFATMIWAANDITGTQLLATMMTCFGGYVAKEGIAKGSEAFRDKGIP